MAHSNSWQILNQDNIQKYLKFNIMDKEQEVPEKRFEDYQ